MTWDGMVVEQGHEESDGGARGGRGHDECATLHARFVRRRRQRAAWDAEEARDLRAAEKLRLWTQYGCVTLVEYLEVRCGIDPRTALERIRVSHALGELPLINDMISRSRRYDEHELGYESAPRSGRLLYRGEHAVRCSGRSPPCACRSTRSRSAR